MAPFGFPGEILERDPKSHDFPLGSLSDSIAGLKMVYNLLKNNVLNPNLVPRWCHVGSRFGSNFGFVWLDV